MCVVGSFNADLVLRVAHLPGRGQTVIGSSCERFLGGKGFNQAVAAARSGAATTVVGAVGDDEHAREIRRALELERVDATGVRSITGVPTGMAFPIVEDSGENSIIIVPGANHALTVADIEGAAALIARAAVVLLQLEVPLDVIAAAAGVARRAGATVVLNPAPAVPDLHPLAGLVDVVVPNEHELAELTGDLADLAAAAASLSAATGAHSIVVTLGEHGAYAWTGDGELRCPGRLVDSVDTVGAGDAFCGALAARLAAGDGLERAMTYANAAGALATTRPGAGPAMPTRTAVEALLADAQA